MRGNAPCTQHKGEFVGPSDKRKGPSWALETKNLPQNWISWHFALISYLLVQLTSLITLSNKYSLCTFNVLISREHRELLALSELNSEASRGWGTKFSSLDPPKSETLLTWKQNQEWWITYHVSETEGVSVLHLVQFSNNQSCISKEAKVSKSPKSSRSHS